MRQNSDGREPRAGRPRRPTQGPAWKGLQGCRSRDPHPRHCQLEPRNADTKLDTQIYKGEEQRVRGTSLRRGSAVSATERLPHPTNTSTPKLGTDRGPLLRGRGVNVCFRVSWTSEILFPAAPRPSDKPPSILAGTRENVHIQRPGQGLEMAACPCKAGVATRESSRRVVRVQFLGPVTFQYCKQEFMDSLGSPPGSLYPESHQ